MKELQFLDGLFPFNQSLIPVSLRHIQQFPEVQHKHTRLKAPEQSLHVESVGGMSSLKARKANTSRVEHLQSAHFKNYYEMKRFMDEREILCRDHRRSMFLINKEIKELQKTLMDINLISGYCHEAYAAHLRSVSIAFSTCKESKKENTCGSIDFNVESGDSVKSKRMFSQKHDGLGDETSVDCEKDLSEVKRHALTLQTYKKSNTNTYISPHKDVKNNKDYLKASLSHFEFSLRECTEKDEDKSDGCPQRSLPKSPSYIAETDLKNSSSTPRHFTLDRRAKPVHQRRQKVTLRKSPAPRMRNPLLEHHCRYMAIQQQVQDSKSLSRYLQNKDGMDNGRSHISKAAIKHSLDLLIKEYNHSQNADMVSNNKQRGLEEKVSNFVSELLEFRCDV